MNVREFLGLFIVGFIIGFIFFKCIFVVVALLDAQDAIREE